MLAVVCIWIKLVILRMDYSVAMLFMKESAKLLCMSKNKLQIAYCQVLSTVDFITNNISKASHVS